MTKLSVKELIVVEGKYDAARLSNIIDGLIVTTDGFGVFSNNQLRDMIKKLGKERGIIILTDSDGAGFKIRTFLNNITQGLNVKNIYIPTITGKEARKALPSKEGFLGVEGIDSDIILSLIKQAGVGCQALNCVKNITYTDLYELGLSGKASSKERRNIFLQSIGLPLRLSKKALCEVLSSLYTLEELQQKLKKG